jgi:putative SOS response-associated peptidase YedK
MGATQGVPYCITLKDSEVLAFAGLWDAWKDPSNGEWTQARISSSYFKSGSSQTSNSPARDM